MALIVLGRLNKQAGGAPGISEITVKAHRGNVMRKMNADSCPTSCEWRTSSLPVSVIREHVVA
jgi:FixJ family two-component response regulator